MAASTCGPFSSKDRGVVDRIRLSLDEGDPNPAQLAKYGRDVGHSFALRAAVNAITGTGVAIVLWLLGVDFPLLWGVVTFLLSFIPTSECASPASVVAWAEYDLTHAVVVQSHSRL
jgi:predicted PurR-regulated permease PerM